MDYLVIDCLPVFNLSLPFSMDSAELAEEFMKFSTVEKRTPNLVSSLVPLYKLYSSLFSIPQISFEWSGGTQNSGLLVLKEHSEMIAENLHDYFMQIRDDFFKKEGFDLSIIIVQTEWIYESHPNR